MHILSCCVLYYGLVIDDEVLSCIVFTFRTYDSIKEILIKCYRNHININLSRPYSITFSKKSQITSILVNSTLKSTTNN